MGLNPDKAVPTFVFIDESGNFDFSGKGTDFFVVSAFITDSPQECGRALSELTYEFLAEGLNDQIPFHGSENSTSTRHRVINRLCSDSHSCFVHSIYADKHLAHPTKHSDVEFYSLIGGAMGKYLAKTLSGKQGPIVMLFDSLLPGKRGEAFLKKLKPALNTIGVRYQIGFRNVSHDVNGQIADYYAWALFRSLEASDDTWINKLPGLHTQFNIFQNGHTKYW